MDHENRHRDDEPRDDDAPEPEEPAEDVEIPEEQRRFDTPPGAEQTAG